MNLLKGSLRDSLFGWLTDKTIYKISKLQFNQVVTIGLSKTKSRCRMVIIKPLTIYNFTKHPKILSNINRQTIWPTGLQELSWNLKMLCSLMVYFYPQDNNKLFSKFISCGIRKTYQKLSSYPFLTWWSYSLM